MSATFAVIGSAPACIPITVVGDQDNTLTFILADADGHAVDISNDSVSFTVRDTYGGTAQIATMTNTSSGHLDPTNGTTQFTVSKSQIDTASAANTMQSWVYEVRRLTGGSSLQLIYLQGEFRVMPAVTAG